jgi:hypothetical protein
MFALPATDMTRFFKVATSLLADPPRALTQAINSILLLLLPPHPKSTIGYSGKPTLIDQSSTHPEKGRQYVRSGVKVEESIRPISLNRSCNFNM